MEWALIVIGLCALGALAVRYGADTRDFELRSAEERLARHGMTWSPDAARQRPDAPRLSRLRRATHALRHPVAVALYRVAHWLAPELQRATG
jgi:hypothetical protein